MCSDITQLAYALAGGRYGQSTVGDGGKDRERFVDQARREGMSLSAWMRTAARERLEARQRVKLFESPEDVKEFPRSCAALDGPETEPDWDEHLQVMNESRSAGVTGT